MLVALSFIQGKVARLQTLSIFSYHLNSQDTLRSIATRWFSLYSPSTLFLKGDINPQHTPPNTGPLLLLDSIFIFFYALNYIYFLDQYFVHGKKKNDGWQYGYKQIVEKITPIQEFYQKIIVQQSLEQPYIFFLFFQKIDPSKYQKIANEVFVPNETGKDMGLVSRIDNIEFQDIDWLNKKPIKGNLYIMPSYKLDQQQKFYQEYKQVDEIKDLNGFSLFKIVKI